MSRAPLVTDAIERTLRGLEYLMPTVGLVALLALLAIALDTLGRWALRGARWLRGARGTGERGGGKRAGR